MSSTSNKNTPGNYQLEQLESQKQRAYHNYQGRSVNNVNCLPGDGLLSGRCPSMILSHNCTDIESELFGVGSTNLVHAKTINKTKFSEIKKFIYL